MLENHLNEIVIFKKIFLINQPICNKRIISEIVFILY